jgi:hypothetical protein
MPIADSMKNFVAELKAEKSSRHAGVQANRDITASILKENKDFLAQTHEQNRQKAENTRGFLRSSNEARKQDYNATMESVHAAIDSIKEYAKGITAESRLQMDEARKDRELAHQYWMSISSGEEVVEESLPAEIPEKEPQPKIRKAKKASAKKVKVASEAEETQTEDE